MTPDVPIGSDRAAIPRSWALITVALCFATAMLEGFDLQSVGVAARRIVAEFHLSAADMGWVASASTIGLLPGAILGGRLADRIGRKRVLVGAALLFGAGSLATAAAPAYSALLAIRFLTGLGLGAGLPNLIALSVEAATPGSRSRFIGMMYCGVPAGGAVASVVSILGGGTGDWRTIFYVGGALPLLIAPLLVFALPESSQFRERLSRASGPSNRAPGAEVLFGGGRALSTLLLWLCFFFHLLVIYLLLNWLPLLLAGKGFSPVEVGTIQLVFNIGGVAGNLAFGWLMDKAPRRTTAMLTYLCLIGFMAALAYVQGLGPTATVGFAVGVFAVGGQIVLYAMAPLFYPTLMRGTGVGWSVAVGRLGSFAGPVLAGQLINSGLGPTAVLMGAIPGLALAAAGAVTLMLRPQAGD